MDQIYAVVLSYKRKGLLKRCLDGINAQTRRCDAVIVVDNASQDGTAAMINLEFPEVHLIVMPHSRCGACETFNIGFAGVYLVGLSVG